MICQKCGTTIHEGDLFCAKCGSPVKQTTGAIDKSENERKAPKKIVVKAASTKSEDSLAADTSNTETRRLSSEPNENGSEAGKHDASSLNNKKTLVIGILIVALLVAILFGFVSHRKNDSNPSEASNNTVNQAKETGSWGTSYSDTITQYEKKYGRVELFHPLETGPYYLVGLVDAKLFDFNNDNIPELVMMYTSPADSFEITSDGVVEEKGHFFYDILIMKDGRAEKVYTGEPTLEAYELGHVFLDFVSIDNTYCLGKNEQASDWDYRESYYGFDGDTFKELFSSRVYRENVDNEIDSYLLNGNSVSEDEWNNWNSKVTLYDEVFYQAEENSWDKTISESFITMKKGSIESVKDQCSKNDFSGNEASVTPPVEDDNASTYYPDDFSFYSISSYNNENGECVLLEIKDYDAHAGTVVVGNKPQAFVLGNGLLKTVDYETDLSSYEIHRGPYSFQIQSDKAVSVMGYGQEIRNSTKIGTNGFIVDLYYTVYANPHENNFVTMSELDLSSVKEVTIDNMAYRQYKVK